MFWQRCGPSGFVTVTGSVTAFSGQGPGMPGISIIHMTRIGLGPHFTIQCPPRTPKSVENPIRNGLSLEPSCVLHMNTMVFSDTLTFPGAQLLYTLLFRAIHCF